MIILLIKIKAIKSNKLIGYIKIVGENKKRKIKYKNEKYAKIYIYENIKFICYIFFKLY